MILGIDGRLANEVRPAGAGYYCREVLRALRDLDRCPGLRVYLDAPPRDDFPLDRSQIQLLERGPFWTHRILARELRRNPPEVFYSPLAQVPMGCPCPTLATVLDMAAWSHPEFFPWTKRALMRLQAGHAIRKADHLIAISERTASDVQQRFARAKDKLSVATPGCAARFFEAVSSPAGTILSTLPPRYVLYLGQVQPRKNLLRLMKAFEEAVEAQPDLPHHLVLAGGLGWQNDAIYRAAWTSPLAHRIHFLDYVPDHLVPTLVAGADVLALVSLWEGFGLPVVEAMAAGTAVLVSNCSSLPDVAGDAGLLVDPKDTGSIASGLVRLLLDGQLRNTCVAKGRERARLFRWEETARVIVDAAIALRA